MFAPELAVTTDFQRCLACGSAQKARDKFCRQCGVSQSRRLEQLNYLTGSTEKLTREVGRSGDETMLLTGRMIPGRSYSGKLVSIVTQDLSERTSTFHASRWTMFLISLLVTPPLWLMIVLLSPLDAYFAAKDLAKQVCPR